MSIWKVRGINVSIWKVRGINVSIRKVRKDQGERGIKFCEILEPLA